MSAPEVSFQSAVASIRKGDLVVLISAWKPHTATKQFINLLQNNHHESVVDQNADFLATRVDRPNSQDQVVFLEISDYTQARGSFPYFETMENNVLCFLITTIGDFKSYHSAFSTWLAFAVPKKVSKSVIFIPSEMDRAEEMRSLGSSISWIEHGWGLYVLQDRESQEAWGIVDAEIGRSQGGFRSRLQDEMMVLKFRLYETEEGVALCESLQKLLREQKNTLREIEESLEATENPFAQRELREELKAAYVLYRGEIRDLFEKISSLGIIPGKTAIQFFQDGIIRS